MAKLTTERLPQPPAEYSQRQQQALVRILQLVFQRTDYAQQSEVIADRAKSWLGL